MNYTDTETDVITADSFEELNYKQKKLLLAAHRHDNEDRQKYADALIKIIGDGVYNKIEQKFRDQSYRLKIIENLDKKGIICTTVKSGNYPNQLNQIPVPPLVLYMRGNVGLLGTRMFAVVGSRKTTAGVLEECKRICSELSSKVTVVTGVADGADSAAVKGAADTGNFICVLPCGHGKSNAVNPVILRTAEERGLTVSEFPPSIPAQRYTFHLRNRIIAGLSEGVLVVSAAEKSGALSTASYAADYSKDVFAFPYNIGIASGAGCNNLIRNGAFLCENAKDVLSVLGLEADERKEPELDNDETAVITALKEEGELHAERLAHMLNISVTDVVTICSMLEIKGLIIRTGGNSFTAL